MAQSEAVTQSRQLEGLSGVITGGASGIGEGLVHAFIAAGARVAVLDQSEGVVAAGEALGGDSFGIQADVSDEASVDRAFAQAHERFGRLDFLVNNAGVRQIKPFVELELADWQRVVDIDLTGTFLCCRAAIRLMLGKGELAIVNIGSNSGTAALTKRAAYISSKAGVAGLTRAITMELAGEGIRCNTIAPGLIETPLSAHYFEDPEMRRIVLEGMPVKRWGQVDEIAGPAIFLCSPAAQFVHGEIIHVDGGWIAGKGY
jgi:NAD(P)-dependent dehydrogenase (short-subunit alcohol dehydrogenase family)